MSKKSLNSSNTLLNYFSKSPATPKTTQAGVKPTESPLSSKKETPTSKKSLKFGKHKTVATHQNNPSSTSTILAAPKSSESSETKSEKKTAKVEPASDDEDDVISGPTKRKRSRIARIADSDDSDRENESDNSQPEPMSISTRKKPAAMPESPLSKKKQRLESTDSLNFEEKLKKNSQESQELVDVKLTEDDSELKDVPTVYAHSKLEFLKPQNIRDKQKRKLADPKYDPTTLHVPEAFLKDLTPAMRQWWELKSDHFDSVLFFKVGKFYELYHMDADIGVRELGFTYMRGEFAHSGFPEQSFNRMAGSLIDRGFKIARVEQTETPDMMAERVKTMSRATKFDKVVRREICQVVNRGTQVFGQQVDITNDHQPNYMLAICEKAALTGHRFGIAFIDTSIGEFSIGEFDDDKHCSRLLTLLSHNPPVLVLYERGGVSERVQQVFKFALANKLKEGLLADSQFWSSEKTLKTLAEEYYKKEMPEVLTLTQNADDHLGLTPNGQYRLALRSLGACIWYLKKCVIDEQIMSMARFSVYAPPDTAAGDLGEVAARIARSNRNKFMVLDAITLSNLKITNDERSLYNTLDNCCTKFGKRLLNYWVCSPSCERSVITERQEAVAELMTERDLLNKVRELLAMLPDLERQLAQIHTFGNKNRSKNHPDGRAILFEQRIYNKKKIQVSSASCFTQHR